MHGYQSLGSQHSAFGNMFITSAWSAHSRGIVKGMIEYIDKPSRSPDDHFRFVIS